MLKKITRFLKDERGSQFIENMLWIIIFSLGVAVVISGLSTATKDKFTELTDKINQVGTP